MHNEGSNILQPPPPPPVYCAIQFISMGSSTVIIIMIIIFYFQHRCRVSEEQTASPLQLVFKRIPPL